MRTIRITLETCDRNLFVEVEKCKEKKEVSITLVGCFNTNKCIINILLENILSIIFRIFFVINVFL